MIIINADDFGLSESVNKAIIKAFEEGIISSTTIMANMPAFEDAIKLAIDNKIDNCIGLHFNLMEGQPLTDLIRKCPRLCSDGKNFSYKRNSVFKWTKQEKNAIRVEFRAQYERVLNAGIKPSHLDSHLHVHTEIPIYCIIRDVIRDLGITKIRKSRNLGVSLKVLPYKFIINSLFKLDGLRTTKYFTEYGSTDKVYDDIEWMCHPVLDSTNSHIIDAMTGKSLGKVFDKLDSYQSL